MNITNNDYLNWIYNIDDIYIDSKIRINACDSIKETKEYDFPLFYNEISIYALENSIPIISNNNRKYYLININKKTYEIGLYFKNIDMSYYAKHVEYNNNSINIKDIENYYQNKTKKLIKINK